MNSNDEATRLRQFEDAHRQLHGQLDEFIGSIKQLYVSFDDYVAHVNIQGVMSRMEEWRNYFSSWEGVAQDLRNQGRPEVLERLRHVQRELAQWTPELMAAYGKNRQQIVDAQLAASAKRFKDWQEERDRVQREFDRINEAWMKNFMRR